MPASPRTTGTGTPPAAATTTPPKLPGVLMGLGLGGFLDGILLHQIFQWHHMLTDTGEHPAETVAGLGSGANSRHRGARSSECGHLLARSASHGP